MLAVQLTKVVPDEYDSDAPLLAVQGELEMLTIEMIMVDCHISDKATDLVKTVEHINILTSQSLLWFRYTSSNLIFTSYCFGSNFWLSVELKK